MEACRLQSPRQRQLGREVGRLGLHADRDAGHEINLTTQGSQAVASGNERRAGVGGTRLRAAPLAGGSACPDLEDEVSYGREGEVWAVAEDGVARTGQAHQAGGLRRQPAG